MVYVLLGTGFEEMEAITPIDLLRRAGIGVITVGLNGQTVFGGHNIGIQADITIDQLDLAKMEMIVLPGGLGGVASIKNCPKAMAALDYARKNDKWIAAICAAPTILAQEHITDHIRAVCYPGCEEQMGMAQITSDACVRHDKVITGTSAGCAIPFALELIRALKGEEVAQQVKEQIVIR
ncbi:MAG: DJ-1/PfpI family protein [Oscillospiraceae bacterium]|nr:DJ-1/PfpI family protein [Oscillospiraceae bacterium]